MGRRFDMEGVAPQVQVSQEYHDQLPRVSKGSEWLLCDLHASSCCALQRGNCQSASDFHNALPHQMEPAFISLRGVRTREFVPLAQPRQVDMILHRSTDQTLSHMRQSLARVATSVGRTYSFHGAAQAGLPRRPKISRLAPLKPASGALMNLPA